MRYIFSKQIYLLTKRPLSQIYIKKKKTKQHLCSFIDGNDPKNYMH